MPNKQFKLKVEPAFWAELDDAAKKYGKPSANMVALEIVKEYFPLWLDLAEAHKRAYDEQREKARHTPDKSTPAVLRFKTRASQNKLKPKAKRANSD